MKKSITLTVCGYFIINALLGCKPKTPSSSADYMILDEVSYIENFPQTFLPENPSTPDIDIIGIRNFRIYDSLLIFSTNDKEGFWSFFSLPDYTFLGKFLSLGKGPYEFFQSPSVRTTATFFKENNTLFVGIYNFRRGDLYKMNIDESIKNNRLEISTIHDSLPPSIFNFAMIDSSTFFCREITDEHTQQLRYLSKNDIKKTTLNIEKLNLSSIKKGEDFNILATKTTINHQKKIITEMPVYLNYINMYSLDDSFGKTICLGSKLDNIQKIQNTSYNDRLNTFFDMRLYPDFWAVMYANEREIDYQTERKKIPVIFLFDWDGKPLAKLEFDKFMTSFDIDLIHGNLYTLDAITDEFYKYDISHILEEL